jgi:hypothetical protein
VLSLSLSQLSPEMSGRRDRQQADISYCGRVGEYLGDRIHVFVEGENHDVHVLLRKAMNLVAGGGIEPPTQGFSN